MNINKKLISMNYSKGVTIIPEYIVVHETDNWNIGANAQMHYNYWNTNSNAQSSVHFICDDKEVLQLAELNWRCWHVGDNNGYSNITNSNSIGIEICVNSDGDYTKARQNCIELVKWLLQVTGLTIDKVVRHKDASGKWCPRNMLDNPSLWEDFKAQIGGNVEMNPILQLQKDLNILCHLGANGEKLVEDGLWGNNTYTALCDFQSKNGLVVTGEYDEATKQLLDKIIRGIEIPVVEPEPVIEQPIPSPTPEKSWWQQTGEDAIIELAKLGYINNPETWTIKDLENTPVHAALFFEMLRRILNSK